MRFILDLASGENLTDEPGYIPDRVEKHQRIDAEPALLCPQLAVAAIEAPATASGKISLAGLDVEALIKSIED